MSKKYIIIKYFLFFISLSSLASCSLSDENHFSINLKGKWKIIFSDTQEIPLSENDDSHSDIIVLPGNWSGLIKKSRGLETKIWLKKEIIIPAKLKGRLLCLDMGRIATADETFFNGIKIGKTGRFPEKNGLFNYYFSWLNNRRYFIPESLIKYNQKNSVAVRVYSHVISGINGSISINEYNNNFFREATNSFHSTIIIASISLNIMFFLGIILLYIFQRKRIIYLYFSIMLLFTLAANFAALDVPVVINGLLRFKIFLLTYITVNFFVLHTIKKFFGFKNILLSTVSSIFLLTISISIILAQTSPFLIFYSGTAAVIFSTICIILSTVLYFIYLNKDPRRYWYFLFVAIPVPVSVLKNSCCLLNFRFNELPVMIFLHVPLAFSILVIYMIYNFERARKEKDSLYAALLKKSRNIQRLLNSLQKKDARPEPRDIIKDLIEYLDTNYNEKYDRKSLSKKFGINEDYMGQVFKKITGTNISNYINTNRIEASKDLLMDTDAKIIDIAYHIGFDNLTHFHRLFKKQTAVTPSKYRELMGDKN